MTNPIVSVIIMPVYNGEKYIAEAIESILSQTYKNFEIIIINDCSTDNCFEKVKPYLNQSNVKYIQQENKGTAAARNTGIMNSSGEFIAFLDQDDLWLTDKLKIQVEYLRGNPKIGLLHGNISYIDKDGLPLPPNPGLLIGASGMCFRDLFLINRIATLTVLVKCECIQKVGLFDESIRFCDDYALWLRIAKYFPVGYIDQCLSLYRMHESSTSQDIIGHKANNLKVLKKILVEFPDTWEIVGKERVNARFFYLTYYLATSCFISKRYRETVQYFLKDLRIDIIKFISMSNLLSPAKRDALEWYKYKINQELINNNQL